MADTIPDTSFWLATLNDRIHSIPLALLPIAIGLWTIGIPYAWLLALGGKDSSQPSLSQMLYDSNEPPGKIFMTTCLWTSICLLVSNYMFILPNAQVDGQRKMLCYMMRVVSILSIGVLGMIPGRTNQQLHMGAALLGFGCFAIAEVRLLCQHKSLYADEHWWRSLACAAMIMSMFFFEIHHFDIGVGKWAAWRNSWTFRYEIAVGCNVVWQLQLIWAFAYQHLYKQAPSFSSIFPWPHIVLLLIISIDMNHRGEFTAVPAWQSVMVAVGEVVSFVLCVRFMHDRLRGRHIRPASQRSSTYGGVDACLEPRPEGGDASTSSFTQA